MKCEYGCEQDALYGLSNGKKCCSKHYTACPSVRERNSKGLQKAHKDGRMYVFTDDDRIESNVESIVDGIKRNLTQNSPADNQYVKKILLEHLNWKYQCSVCSISEWNGRNITLELDHINGISNDNRIENLRLLCPNCHSQTTTWRGRNKNMGYTKVTDDELVESLKNERNIRQALIKVGLVPKGANYNRAKKLMK